MCFELAAATVTRLEDAATVVDEVHGFKFFDERDLLGFVDGTENPSAQVAVQATLIGAEILGQAGRLGEITPGARADLLLVDGNPLQDLACLTGQGERIPLVMQGGQLRVNALAQ